MKTTTATIQQQIAARLSQVEGRDTARTLSLGDVIGTVTACPKAPGSTNWAHGGGVASAYKYPAYSTVAVAVRRHDGAVVLVLERRRTQSPQGPSIAPADRRERTGATLQRRLDEMQAWAFGAQRAPSWGYGDGGRFENPTDLWEPRATTGEIVIPAGIARKLGAA